MKRIALVALTWTVLLIPAAQAASFDCIQSSTTMEKTICSNPNLSRLDDNLALQFHKALVSASDKELLKHEQREWLRTIRNACIDGKCLEAAYLGRLKQINPNWEKGTNELPPKEGTSSTSKPIDARSDCRDSFENNHAKFIQCVEQGIYDPCDDAGGTWGKGQCAWAWNEIAERKISAAESEIKKRIGKRTDDSKSFELAQSQWRQYRDTYCKFTNSIEDIAEFDVTSDFDLGFCKRRLSEQRAKELEFILRRVDDN